MSEETGKERSARIDKLLENMLRDHPGEAFSCDKIAESVGTDKMVIHRIEKEALDKLRRALDEKRA